MFDSARYIWGRFIHAASVERMLIGASVFRIVAGLTILYQYLINYFDRYYLYGPNAAWSFDAFRDYLRESGSFSLYAFSEHRLYFDLLYHLGLVVTTFWVVGWHTRLMTFLTCVFFWSLHERTPILWDGGDNLLQIVLIYACFAHLGAHLSFDAERVRMRRAHDNAIRWPGAMLHNAAMLAIAIQLSLLYLVSGLAKVQGEMWQSGTALYYVLRTGEFGWPGYAELIYLNVPLMVALTYLTVAFQVSFPFLFWLNRYTRLMALAAGCMFHLGIAAMMGLITFSLFMIAVELMLITDREYRSVLRHMTTLRRRLGWRLQRRLRRVGRSPRLAGLRMRLFFDGWCPLCRSSMRWIRYLDLFGLIELRSFRDPAVVERFGLDPVRAERRIQALAHGRLYEGAEAGFVIATRVPATWPLAPLIWFACRMGVAQPLYDWFASRRMIEPEGCATGACMVPSRTRTSLTRSDSQEGY